MTVEIRQAIQQATAAFEAGNYDEAEAVLLRVVDRTPAYANVFHMLGFISSQRNASDRAVELFRRALALNPKYTEARLGLVLTLASMGAYEQAAREAEILEANHGRESDGLSLAVRGRLANAHGDLGRRYHALGLYAEAIAEFDKALRWCPTFPDLHHRRALSCRDLGRHAEAKASLERALELKPDYVEAYVTLGVLHQKLGDQAQALEAWAQALRLDPQHRLARMYVNQARTSEERGR